MAIIGFLIVVGLVWHATIIYIYTIYLQSWHDQKCGNWSITLLTSIIFEAPLWPTLNTAYGQGKNLIILLFKIILNKKLFINWNNLNTLPTIQKLFIWGVLSIGKQSITYIPIYNCSKTKCKTHYACTPEFSWGTNWRVILFLFGCPTNSISKHLITNNYNLKYTLQNLANINATTVFQYYIWF